VIDVDGVRRVDSLKLPKVLVEVGLASSISEARRLIKGGAVDIDGDVHTSEDFALIDGLVFRVGKKKFLRIFDADSR
jgi:tyrosyl-tRNA synthetase